VLCCKLQVVISRVVVVQWRSIERVSQWDLMGCSAHSLTSLLNTVLCTNAEDTYSYQTLCTVSLRMIHHGVHLLLVAFSGMTTTTTVVMNDAC
jgi:hypothetical protein